MQSNVSPSRKSLLASLISGTFVLAARRRRQHAPYPPSEPLSVEQAQTATSSDDGDESRQQALAVSTGTWIKLVDEWRPFLVNGTQTVRYGSGSSWIQKTVTDSGECTNDFFGNDPAYGIVKSCELLVASPAPDFHEPFVRHGPDPYDCSPRSLASSAAATSWRTWRFSTRIFARRSTSSPTAPTTMATLCACSAMWPF